MLRCNVHWESEEPLLIGEIATVRRLSKLQKTAECTTAVEVRTRRLDCVLEADELFCNQREEAFIEHLQVLQAHLCIGSFGVILLFCRQVDTVPRSDRLKHIRIVISDFD